MAALAGYNPNSSLLPSGGGPIQAMSGGGAIMNPPPAGYNATQTLLPSGPPVPIGGFNGGFINPPNLAGGDNTIPSAEGYVPLPNAPTTAAAPPITLVPPPVKAPAEATTTAPVAANTTKPPTNTKNTENIREIILFGETIKLENPKTMKSDVLTEQQKKALTLFGLDGPGATDVQKKQVLEALYDGKCNSDKPLIMLQNCEPIRRVVQSLALNLLSQLQPVSDTGLTNVKKEDQPVVEFKKEEDGSMAVTLTFKPGQLYILSKYAPKKVSNTVKPPTAPDATKKKGLFEGIFKKKEQPKIFTSADLPDSTAAAPATTTAPATPQKTPEEAPKAPEVAVEAPDLPTTTTSLTKGGYDVITTLGIDNPNMWCYAVSSIQLLFSIPQLREALLKHVCDAGFTLPATNEDIDKLTSDKITDSGILCALKTAFEELNKSTTQFTKTNWEADIKPKQLIDNRSVAYLMKGYLYKRRPTTPAIDNNQQDVDEFIKYLLEIVDKNTELKSSLNSLKWNRETSFKCEKPEFTKPNRVDDEGELFVQLDVNAFTSEKNISYKNKLDKVKKTKVVSLQDLINYFSRPEKLEGDNEIAGCGPDGGKGPGTKADVIEPVTNNEFLIFQINKGSNPVQASTITNQYSINAQPTVTVNGFTYNIYGAILYGGMGSSGHYMYERLYYPPPQTKTSLDGIPFVMYNSGFVTANNNQSYTIDKNAYYIIYQRVSGTPKAVTISEVTNTMGEVNEEMKEKKRANMAESLLGPDEEREGEGEGEEEREEYVPPSPTNVGIPENNVNRLKPAKEPLLAKEDTEEEGEEREEEEDEEVKEARQKLKDGLTTQKNFNEWLKMHKEGKEYTPPSLAAVGVRNNGNNKNKSKPLSASAPNLSKAEAPGEVRPNEERVYQPPTEANVGLKKKKAISWRNQKQPNKGLTNESPAPPAPSTTTSQSKKAMNNLMAARAASVVKASTSKKTGGKTKAETIKKITAIKKKLKGGSRKTFKKAALKKGRVSRKKNNK